VLNLHSNISVIDYFF